jgi:hypothetical protein
MARTQQTIWNQMVSDYTTTVQTMFGRSIDPSAFLPSNWSMYNMEGAIFWIIAGAVALFEQIFDNYVSTTETQIASAPPQTNIWWQNFVINVFQYNATTPQIIQFDTTNINPYYAVVNPAYRIVTQCAIVPGLFGNTTVLVATGGATPVPLTTVAGGQLNALQSTLNTLSIPGININAVSNYPDNLFMQATILYDGNYAAVISTTVIAAINAYLRSIPTSGIVSPNSPVGLMKLTDLIAAVRAVAGVLDVQLENVNVRTNATTFTTASYNMVSDRQWLAYEWNSGLMGGAGYIVPEQTAGYQFTDLRPLSASVYNLYFTTTPPL